MAFGLFFVVFLEFACSSVFFCIGILMRIHDFFEGKTYYKYYNGNFIKKTCPICLEDFKKENLPVFLKECTENNDPKHFFHRECIEKHLDYSNECPVCRKVFKKDSSFKINLIWTNRYDVARFSSGLDRLNY